jgi:hypothetical protein
MVQSIYMSDGPNLELLSTLSSLSQAEIEIPPSPERVAILLSNASNELGKTPIGSEGAKQVLKIVAAAGLAPDKNQVATQLAERADWKSFVPDLPGDRRKDAIEFASSRLLSSPLGKEGLRAFLTAVSVINLSGVERAVLAQSLSGLTEIPNLEQLSTTDAQDIIVADSNRLLDDTPLTMDNVQDLMAIIAATL